MKNTLRLIKQVSTKIQLAQTILSLCVVSLLATTSLYAQVTIDYTSVNTDGAEDDYTTTVSFSTNTDFTIDWGTGQQSGNSYTDEKVYAQNAAMLPYAVADGLAFNQSTGGLELVATNAFAIESMQLGRRAEGDDPNNNSFTIRGYRNGSSVVSDQLTWSTFVSSGLETFTRGSGTWQDDANWQNIDKMVISWSTSPDGSGGVYGNTEFQEIAVLDVVVNEAMALNSAPTVTTSAASSITATGATLSGKVTDDGGDMVTERGFVYGTNPTPTIGDGRTTRVEDGNGTGSFSEDITGLGPKTTYYLRAYAINGQGTSYGSEQSFTTEASSVVLNANPTISFSNDDGFSDSKAMDGEGGSVSISDIDIEAYPINSSGTALTADPLEYHDKDDWNTYPSIITYGATLTHYGWAIKSTNGENFSLESLDFLDWGTWDGATFIIEAFDNGSSKDAVTFAGNTDESYVHLSQLGILSSAFTNVDEIRFYKQGGDETWTALNNIKVNSPVISVLATVTTTASSGITTTTATLGGNITDDGGDPVNERGFVYSTSSNPTTSNSKIEDGDGTGAFEEDITGLDPKTTYYVRAYAINGEGTSYGSEQSFTTDALNALYFDGDAQVTGLSGVNPTEFTIEFKLFLDSETTDWQGIYWSDDGVDIGIFLEDDNTVSLWTTTQLSFKSDVALNYGSWNHVAISGGSSNGLKMYLNGVEVSYSEPAGDPGSPALPVNNMTIGYGPGQYGGYELGNSALDDFRIWSEVRTSKQINDHKNAELSAPYPAALVRYYDFNHGIGGENNAGETVLAERTGKGTNATLSGFSLNGNISNWVETSSLEPLNSTPTDITLNSTTVNQSDGSNAIVGSLSTTDADGGDTHTYTLVTGAGDTNNGSFNINGSELRATDASALAAGEYSVRIQTDDGKDIYQKAFTITMVETLGPPEFTSTPVTEVVYNQPYSYSMTATEVGDLATTISATTLPQWLTLQTGAILSGTPAKSDLGNHSVILEASNDAGSVQQSFSIEVQDNVAPVIQTYSPAKGATEVALQPTLSINFDEEVVMGSSGTLTINNGTIIIRTYDLEVPEDRNGLSISGDNLTLSFVLDTNLPVNTAISVGLSAGFVEDQAGNEFEGFIPESNTWSFTTINKLDQTITFPEISTKTYGNDEFMLGDEFTDQDLKITYKAADSDIIEITDNKARILKAGNTTITATQEGDEETFPAAPITRDLTISKKDLVVSSQEFTLECNESIETFSFEVEGLVYTDEVVNLDNTEFEFYTTYLVGNGTGTYNLEINMGTAQDANYNFIGFYPSTINIVDTTPAEVITKNITLQLGTTGIATIVPADIDNGSTDNCEIDSISLDQDSFDCSHVDNPVTVTLTVKDVNGNKSSETATVTVEDNVVPIVLTKDITVQLDADGAAAIVPSDVDDNSRDNCEIDTRRLDIDSFSCSDVGTPVTVRLTLTDIHGNESSETATVTVEDNVVPVVVTKDITVQLDADGAAAIVPSDIDKGSSDNCEIDTMSLDVDSFSCSDVGIPVMVRLTLTDIHGNESSETATVTVEDNVDPVVVTKDITVQLDADGAAAIVPSDVDDNSRDNCEIDTMNLDVDSFSCSDVGTPVTVTLTLTDIHGNESSETATVTVEDNVVPVVVTKDITVQLDADGVATIVPSDVDDNSWDNCEIDTMSLDIDSFSCSNVNIPVKVTLTVTDVNGNESSETATVTVEDNVDPVVVTKDITVQLDADGAAAIVPSDVDDNSRDNCEIDTMNLDVDSFSCSDVGTPVTVTLTLTDIHGNESSETATVTVEDNVVPVVVTKDITVQLDADGVAAIVPSDVDDNSWDNCEIDTMSLDIDSFSCSNVNIPVKVTLTVTDVNGNESSETATVTVEDNVDPVVVTKDITVQLDADGVAAIVPSDIDKGSSDNCEINTMSLDVDSFSCSDVGIPVMVRLTLTDIHGNESSETATVTVEDNVDPVVVTKDITVQLDADGAAAIVPSDVDDNSSDNCEIDTMNLDVDSFDCADVDNPVTVTLTVTDIHGNESAETATVTVEDNVDPVVVTKDITVQLDADGVAAIVPSDINRGSSDNCEIDTISLDVDSFSCSDVGTPVMVRLTLTDIHGNESSETATVTVEDNVVPVVVTKDITVQLDADGAASIVPSDIHGNSSDNCEIDTMSLDIDSFSCTDVGTPVTVTLTVTDVNGNESSETATVTIEDNVDPVVVTHNITVELDENGAASIIPADIDNGSSDNCEIAGFDLNRSEFSCADLGENSVIIILTDINGNTTSATAVVTIVNRNRPVFTDNLPEIVTECSVSLEELDIPVATGVCEAKILGQVNESLFPITQTTTLEWTFTDESGNTITKDQEITVEDVTAPVPDVAELETLVGGCEIVTIETPTATDNCEGTILATTQDPTSYSEQGDYIITWTFTDASGNTTTQDQFIVVEDNTPPMLIANDIDVEYEFGEFVFITPADIDNGSEDNCGVLELSLDRTEFGEEGEFTVTLTGIDAVGNTSQTTAVVSARLKSFISTNVHVVPTLLERSSMAKVIVSENSSIFEVQVLETETGKYKLFEGTNQQQMEIDVAPFKGVLLIRVIDQNGEVHLKKLIAL